MNTLINDDGVGLLPAVEVQPSEFGASLLSKSGYGQLGQHHSNESSDVVATLRRNLADLEDIQARLRFTLKEISYVAGCER